MKMDKTWINLCCIFLLAADVLDGHSISKRNAFQLCNLINFYTQRSCLQYNPYGCFCGYGQRVAKPRDSVDTCCKIHDDCYGSIVGERLCYFWSSLLVGYKYSCSGSTCTCAEQSTCSRRVCECDLRLAQCLNTAEFNPEYMNYDWSRCV